MLTGIELAQKTDADVIGIGEMGIGNTTTSSAVLSVLLDADVESVTGRGGGITDASFLKKKQVIKDAIAINNPNKNDVVDVLALEEIKTALEKCNMEYLYALGDLDFSQGSDECERIYIVAKCRKG